MRKIILSTFLTTFMLTSYAHAEVKINPYPVESLKRKRAALQAPQADKQNNFYREQVITDDSPAFAEEYTAVKASHDVNNAYHSPKPQVPVVEKRGDIEAHVVEPDHVSMLVDQPPLERIVREHSGMPSESLLDMPATGHSWNASVGQDLRDVLKGWSSEEHVKFVWDMDMNFVIPMSINVPGTYEDAVRVVLDQYKGQDVRPVANLYLPRDDRQKTLVISLER